MKKLKLLSIAFLALLTLGTFTACSSDDDNNGGGNKVLSLNGQSYGLNYGYWDTPRGQLALEFANVDLPNLKTPPSTINVLTLNVEAGDNVTSLVTGTYEAYMEFFAMNISSGETIYHAGAAGIVKVTIEGSGNSYKVTIPQTTITYYAGADDSDGGTEVPFSFSYSGSLVNYEFD